MVYQNNPKMKRKEQRDYRKLSEKKKRKTIHETITVNVVGNLKNSAQNQTRIFLFIHFKNQNTKKMPGPK